MSVAAEVGGAKYTAAITAARNAVAELEIAQDAVRASGGPVSPAAVAQLATYDVAVQAASASLEKHASASRIAGAEANLMRDNVAGAARAVAGMGGELGTLVLGIGAAVVAFDLIPTIIEKIDEKSKAWASSIVDTVSGLDEEDRVVRKANESQAAYEARLNSTLNTMADIQRARIAMAAGILQETSDLKAAQAEWQGYEAAMHGSLDQYPVYVAALKAMGVSFKATSEEMRLETVLFGQGYQRVLREDGIDAANAWAIANKSALDRIVSYYQNAKEQVPPALAQIAAAINLVSKAEQDAAAAHTLRDKFLDEVNASRLLVAQLQASKDEFGNAATAVLGLRKEIDAQITSLQKLYLTDEADRKTRDAIVAQLKELEGAHVALTGKLADEASATDKLRERLDTLSKTLADNGKALEANLAKIEEHRKTSIAAAQDETTKTIASLQEQVKATEASHAAREISDSDYNKKLNALFAEQAIAKQKEYDQEVAINRDAEKLRNDAVQQSAEATKKLVDNNKDLGDSYDAIRKIVDDYKASQQTVLAQLTEQQRQNLAAKGAVDQHAESQKNFVKEMKAVVDGVSGANSSLKTHADHHTTLHTSVPTTTKHISELGSQFGVTAGEIGPLDAGIDGLISKLGALQAAAMAAAAAVASITEGAPAEAVG